MRKLATLLIASAITMTCLTAHGQDKEFRDYYTPMVNPITNSKVIPDTVKGTVSLVQRIPEKRKGDITIVTVLTRLADTTRGTLSLEVSIDGTNFTRYGTDTLQVAPIFAAGSIMKYWNISGRFRAYQVRFNGGAAAGRTLIQSNFLWKDTYIVTP